MPRGIVILSTVLLVTLVLLSTILLVTLVSSSTYVYMPRGIVILSTVLLVTLVSYSKYGSPHYSIPGIYIPNLCIVRPNFIALTMIAAEN